MKSLLPTGKVEQNNTPAVAVLALAATLLNHLVPAGCCRGSLVAWVSDGDPRRWDVDHGRAGVFLVDRLWVAFLLGTTPLGIRIGSDRRLVVGLVPNRS